MRCRQAAAACLPKLWCALRTIDSTVSDWVWKRTRPLYQTVFDYLYFNHTNEHTMYAYCVMGLREQSPTVHYCSAQYSTKETTTVDNGYLGSRNDEERSEMRYVM